MELSLLWRKVLGYESFIIRPNAAASTATTLIRLWLPVNAKRYYIQFAQIYYTPKQIAVEYLYIVNTIKDYLTKV